ncbi:MAG: prolyl oligopeptidase family serine peptidase [Planctomycetales bacterium]|nr:prolyl oligopeptidase family serine peptidase [Planctomycetales bacterium]
MIARLPLALSLVLLVSAARPATLTAAEGTAGKQVELTFKDAEGDVGYLLYLPADYDASADVKWPLMLFLHGRGESRGPLSLVAKWGPPRFAQRGDSLPYILVSPQCPNDGNWSDEVRQRQLVRLLDAMLASHRADADRVCLTGLSMGGSGTWTLAAAHPERFAAIAPICGRSDASKASALKDLPIWVFHGDQDPLDIKQPTETVEAIRKAGGGQVRFTTLEHVGHNSWSAAYATPELTTWMLKQKRAGR